MNQATRKEYLTGRNGRYATDSVSGVTPNMLTYGNTDKSFRGGMTGNVLASHPDYSNPHDTLHNNIGPVSVFEQYMDSKVFIDAEFRDTSFTDNRSQPFKFTVRFKESSSPPIPTVVSFEYNGNIFEYNRYKRKSPEIILPHVFHNVKYAVIDNLIMPTHIAYQTEQNGSINKVEDMSLVRTEKYLVLRIDQFENHKKVSSNPKLDDKCFIMKNDDTSGVRNQFYIAIHDQITAFQSVLPTIDRMDIEVLDCKGNILEPTLDGEPTNFHELYQKTIEELRAVTELNNPNTELADRLENRLISLREIVGCIDPEIHITINAVVQQINTDTKWRR